MIHEIYLDLDDTLNAFTGFVGWLHNVAKHEHDLSWFEPQCGFSLELGLNMALQRQGRREKPKGSLWSTLPPKAWNPPLAPLARELVDACAARVGRDDVFVLSASVGAECSEAKHRWLDENFPWLEPKLGIFKFKGKLAGRGRLLIDDGQHNIDAWKKGGGQTFTITKPWNSFEFKPGDDLRATQKIITQLTTIL